MLDSYDGVKYSYDKNGTVSYVSIDGCYLNIENFRALPKGQMRRVYNWLHYMFTAEHKDSRELEMLIHSMHIQEIIAADPSRPFTDTVNFVLLLNKIEEDAAKESSANENHFSIVDLLTDAVTTMHVAPDHFVFAYNTLARYGYIREKNVAKRLVLVENMINEPDYEFQPTRRRPTPRQEQ